MAAEGGGCVCGMGVTEVEFYLRYTALPRVFKTNLLFPAPYVGRFGIQTQGSSRWRPRLWQKT